MNWFIGYGIILALYIVTSLEADRFNDSKMLKVLNILYWGALGTWDIFYGLFLCNTESGGIAYIISGVVLFWIGIIIFIIRYMKRN